MQRNDRIRILIMAGAVIVLGVGYLFTSAQEKRYRAQEQDQEQPDLPGAEEQEVAHSVVVPPFDMPEVLAGIRDSTPAERVIVNGEALTAVFNYGRLLTPRHYEAAGLRDLSPEVRAELERDPSAHRVQPLRMRGWIESLGKRRRSESLPEEWAGSLRLEDDHFAHFVVLEVPPGAAVGQFVRIDGMFLKLYSAEAPSAVGGRMQGPLLLGPAAVPSYPRVDTSKQIELTALDGVRDDQAGDVTGIPERALWQLMARARAGDDSVDWSSAPVIDGQVIGELLKDGDAYRGKPFRLEISRNMGGWTESAGENPLRLERLTLGWIGNQTWKGQVPIISFYAPLDKPELRDRNGVSKYLTGRGYFFKTKVYERGAGDIGRAPVFVMEAVDVFVPRPDGTPAKMMWGVLVGLVLMIALLWFLLLRDRKKSVALHEELVRRRRARQASLSGVGATLSSKP